MDPDAPHGTLRVAPAAPSPVGALSAAGLRFGGRPLAVEIGADGGVLRVDAADGVRITVGRDASEKHDAAAGSRPDAAPARAT